MSTFDSNNAFATRGICTHCHLKRALHQENGECIDEGLEGLTEEQLRYLYVAMGQVPDGTGPGAIDPEELNSYNLISNIRFGEFRPLPGRLERCIHCHRDVARHVLGKCPKPKDKCDDLSDEELIDLARGFSIMNGENISRLWLIKRLRQKVYDYEEALDEMKHKMGLLP